MKHRATFTYDGYCWYWNCTCGAYARSGADSQGQAADRSAGEHLARMQSRGLKRGRIHRRIADGKDSQ